MSDSAALVEALASLQEAQQKTEEAHRAILDHNIDKESHEDIRAALVKILNDGNVYTKSQIEDIIQTGLTEHQDKPLAEAHPEFVTYSEEIERKITNLEGRIEAIEKWIKGEDESGEVTNLNRAIQEVENAYAQRLRNLNDSYQLAVANNDTTLATEITNRITALLEEKNAEIIKVIEQYTA